MVYLDGTSPLNLTLKHFFLQFILMIAKKWSVKLSLLIPKDTRDKCGKYTVVIKQEILLTDELSSQFKIA